MPRRVGRGGSASAIMAYDRWRDTGERAGLRAGRPPPRMKRRSLLFAVRPDQDHCCSPRGWASTAVRPVRGG